MSTDLMIALLTPPLVPHLNHHLLNEMQGWTNFQLHLQPFIDPAILDNTPINHSIVHGLAVTAWPKFLSP